MRALVAMSGGVDSSVAAAMAVDSGWDVIGITLKQWVGDDGRLPVTGCCTLADAEDARRAAATLGIPHYVWDFTDQFAARVVDPFVAGYLAGTTPNPCIACNREVRFSAFVERADELGCDVVVTGHHARAQHGDGGPELWRGADRAKDQSYVLHAVDRDSLGRARFPVGEITKAEVRRHAADLGLRVAGKPDSQDLCFLGDGGPTEFLRSRAPESRSPGDVVDVDGTVLGRHDGAAGFTIGQRRGLGIAVGEPRYVVAVRPDAGEVVVGTRDQLMARRCAVEGVRWLAEPADVTRARVQVRSHGPAVAATIVADGIDRWRVEFDEPVQALTPGQSAVAYLGDRVLGGGVIGGVPS